MEQLYSFMEMTGYEGDNIKVGIFAVFLAGVYLISKERDGSQTKKDAKNS